MTQDLLKRLREAGNDYTVAWGSGDLYDEAADEIERLTAVLARIRAGIAADRCDGDTEWAAGVNAACQNHLQLVDVTTAAGAAGLDALKARAEYIRATLYSDRIPDDLPRDIDRRLEMVGELDRQIVEMTSEIKDLRPMPPYSWINELADIAYRMEDAANSSDKAAARRHLDDLLKHVRGVSVPPPSVPDQS